MKVIKPQGLGLLFKVYEHRQRCHLVVTALGFFAFDAKKLLPEISMWKLVAKELGKDAVLDGCMNKLRGELLVHGSCYAPGKVTTCPVKVTLGSIDKSLYVVGDRFWQREVFSEPEPFERMELRYENAFGGEGFAENPLGKGYAPIETPDGPVHPLPNIELPGQMIRRPTDRPEPAGFGSYDLTWPQRFSMVGTYGDEWLKEDFPGLAKDIDWRFFNEAPADQQIEGYFRGGETFVVENMHPEKAQVRGALPNVVVRAFVHRKAAEGVAIEPVGTVLDTVHLFPHVERGIAIYRGLVEVTDDDAGDVATLMVAAEAPDAPKELAHYRAVLELRLARTDPTAGLRDSDLMPPNDPAAAPHPDDKIGDMAELLKRDDLTAANQRRGMEQRLADVRQRLDAAGLQNVALPELPPPAKAPTLEELPAVIEEARRQADEAKKKAEEAKAQADIQLRELCAKAGLDADQLLAKAKAEAGGPPRFSAAAEIEKLEDMKKLSENSGVPLPAVAAKLADPELRKQLEGAEQGLKDAYRKTAHLQSPAPAVDATRSQELGRALLAKVQEGSSVDGADFTRADLSGAPLAGADLSGVFLEGADLTGADLRRAKLDRAVLARAKLHGAQLDQASLVEANLGSADLTEASATGADCTRAVLAKADLSRAAFAGATLSRADLAEARVSGADLGAVRAERLTVLNTDWSGLRLAGANLTKSVFLKCTLGDVDFSGATLTSATFIETRVDGAKFAKATLDNLRAVKGCSFRRADFSGANLAGANLRGSDLEAVDLGLSELDGADLSECNLSGAKLGRSNAKGSRFVRANLTDADLSQANLMQAVLQKAVIRGARFDGANLFQADLVRAESDDATSLRDALIKRVRVAAPRKRDV
jgi:uncharacterized protein YjbI with pentapeptide repeats